MNNLSGSSWNDSKRPPGWHSCSHTLLPQMQTSPLFLFFLHQLSLRVPFLDPFHHPWGSLTVSNQYSHFPKVSLEVLLSLTEIWLSLMRLVNPSWSSLSKEDSVCSLFPKATLRKLLPSSLNVCFYLKSVCSTYNYSSLLVTNNLGMSSFFSMTWS